MLSSIISLTEKSTRPSWDEYYMSIAFIISVRSPSVKKRVGSVIVKDNRIITSGYNGFPTGMSHTSIIHDGKEINTIHAEQNAISDAAKRGVSLNGATLYSTHEPCIHCTKYIISAGITNVKYYKSSSPNPTDNVRTQLYVESGTDITNICQNL